MSDITILRKQILPRGLPRREMHGSVRSRNKSGISGVCLFVWFYLNNFCKLWLLTMSFCTLWCLQEAKLNDRGIKGETQANRKSKIFRTEQWKFDINRIKSKEDMKFWTSVIFIKTFLDQSIWIWKRVSWWCHRLTIFHGFTIFTEIILKIPYCSYEKVKLALYPSE